MRHAITKALLALGIISTMAGCESFEKNLEDKIMAKGYTRSQAEVGAAEGRRRLFTDKTEHEDGTVTYELNYDVFSDEDTLQVVKQTYSDIHESLKTEGSIEWMKYMDSTGIGEHLQKQEKVWKFHLDMLQSKVLERKFKDLVQPHNWYGGYYSYGYYGNAMSQFSVKPDERYSLSTHFPLNRATREFDADYVKKARKSGDIDDKDLVVEEVAHILSFLEKIPNPQYKVDKGVNPWTYKRRKGGIMIKSFNLDNDPEKKPDYIEVYRLDDKGDKEELPAVRIFKPSGSDELEVIVADFDFEGDPGYGVPDHVGRVFMIENGQELLQRKELIDLVFQKKRMEESRARPDISDLNPLHIAEAGKVDMAAYDIDNNGWEHFLPDNYTASADDTPTRFKVHVKRDIDPEKTPDHGRMAAEIKWIALEYTGGARVVEFYKPDEKYKGKKVKVNIIGDNVSITQEDGRIERYDVKAVIGDRPFRIDFDRNSSKRWEILDKDEDGKHYEAKRERAKTDDIIPKK
ncbi:MAG: hypothetical protein V1729_03880 [Candidatus Woesearchaeota archaeon]